MPNKFNIPNQIFRNLIVCGGIVIIVIIAGIIPLYSYNANINKDMKNLRQQIDEQKNLQAIYATLTNTMGKKSVRILPNPAKATLSRQETSKFQDVFRAIVVKSGLLTVSLTPDFGTTTGSSAYLSHTAVVRGEFINFRKMLMGLGEIPYLDRIEEISIQQYPEALELRLKIWIALGN
jgi:hypothetical protein